MSSFNFEEFLEEMARAIKSAVWNISEKDFERMVEEVLEYGKK